MQKCPNPNFLILEETHIYGFAFLALDHLEMRWEEKDILLQSDLDIEEKEGLSDGIEVAIEWEKFLIDFVESVWYGGTFGWIPYPDQQVLIQWVWLELYFLICIYIQLQFIDLEEVEHVVYLQPAIHRYNCEVLPRLATQLQRMRQQSHLCDFTYL